MPVLLAGMSTGPKQPSDESEGEANDSRGSPSMPIFLQRGPPALLQIQATASDDLSDPFVENILNDLGDPLFLKDPLGAWPDEQLTTLPLPAAFAPENAMIGAPQIVVMAGHKRNADDANEALTNRTKQKLDPITAGVVARAPVAPAPTPAMEMRVQIPKGKPRGSYKCGDCGNRKKNHICEVTRKKAKREVWCQTWIAHLEEGGSGSTPLDTRFEVVERSIGTWVPLYSDHPESNLTGSDLGAMSSSIAHEIWMLRRFSTSFTTVDEGLDIDHDEVDRHDDEEYCRNIAEV